MVDYFEDPIRAGYVGDYKTNPAHSVIDPEEVLEVTPDRNGMMTATFLTQLFAAYDFQDVEIPNQSILNSTLTAQNTSNRGLFLYFTADVGAYGRGNFAYVKPRDNSVNVILDLDAIITALGYTKSGSPSPTPGPTPTQPVDLSGLIRSVNAYLLDDTDTAVYKIFQSDGTQGIKNLDDLDGDYLLVIKYPDRLVPDSPGLRAGVDELRLSVVNTLNVGVQVHSTTYSYSDNPRVFRFNISAAEETGARNQVTGDEVRFNLRTFDDNFAVGVAQYYTMPINPALQTLGDLLPFQEDGEPPKVTRTGQIGDRRRPAYVDTSPRLDVEDPLAWDGDEVTLNYNEDDFSFINVGPRGTVLGRFDLDITKRLPNAVTGQSIRKRADGSWEAYTPSEDTNESPFIFDSDGSVAATADNVDKIRVFNQRFYHNVETLGVNKVVVFRDLVSSDFDQSAGTRTWGGVRTNLSNIPGGTVVYAPTSFLGNDLWLVSNGDGSFGVYNIQEFRGNWDHNHRVASESDAVALATSVGQIFSWGSEMKVVTSVTPATNPTFAWQLLDFEVDGYKGIWARYQINANLTLQDPTNNNSRWTTLTTDGAAGNIVGSNYTNDIVRASDGNSYALTPGDYRVDIKVAHTPPSGGGNGFYALDFRLSGVVNDTEFGVGLSRQGSNRLDFHTAKGEFIFKVATAGNITLQARTRDADTNVTTILGSNIVITKIDGDASAGVGGGSAGGGSVGGGAREVSLAVYQYGTAGQPAPAVPEFQYVNGRLLVYGDWTTEYPTPEIIRPLYVITLTATEVTPGGAWTVTHGPPEIITHGYNIRFAPTADGPWSAGYDANVDNYISLRESLLGVDHWTAAIPIGATGALDWQLVTGITAGFTNWTFPMSPVRTKSAYDDFAIRATRFGSGYSVDNQQIVYFLTQDIQLTAHDRTTYEAGKTMLLRMDENGIRLGPTSTSTPPAHPSNGLAFLVNVRANLNNSNQIGSIYVWGASSIGVNLSFFMR